MERSAAKAFLFLKWRRTQKSDWRQDETGVPKKEAGQVGQTPGNTAFAVR